MEHPNNNDYLKILELEQSFIKLRWSIVTFFITVSFAIFSFSMQGKVEVVPAYLQQILAIFVYWFSFFIHVLLHKYTDFLRNYLKSMEENKETTLKLRTEAEKYLSKKLLISITQLLVILGVIYTCIVVATIVLI